MRIKGNKWGGCEKNFMMLSKIKNSFLSSVSSSFSVFLHTSQGAWLAQSLEHATPDLGIMSFEPHVEVEFTSKNILTSLYSKHHR